MQAPYTVSITLTDGSGKKIQLFEQCELDDETLVAVQEMIATGFVGLGKAGLALKKSQGNASRK